VEPRRTDSNLRLRLTEINLISKMDSPSLSEISADSNIQKTCQTAYREFGGTYQYITLTASTIEVRVPRAHHGT
jgi:hypothetical protein